MVTTQLNMVRLGDKSLILRGGSPRPIQNYITTAPDGINWIKIGDVSIELCGGPHVGNTKDLGHFKITKEEASSAGVRRIKAILRNR